MLVTEPLNLDSSNSDPQAGNAPSSASAPVLSDTSPLPAGFVALSAAALLAACGGGGSSSGSGPSANPGTGEGTLSGPATNEEAARFLLQAQFSASDVDIATLRNKGYGPWLGEQFNAQPSAGGFAWLNARGYASVNNATRYYDNSYPGDYMIWNQLMTAPDAMRTRVALALSEYFVVSLTGLDVSWRSHVLAAWWDLLATNAFGNFRQLLQGVTLNAAMGLYLNTKGNMK